MRRPPPSIVDAVGRTPLVQLRAVARDAAGVDVYVKLELANPGGSVKDRAALCMIRDALSDGRLVGKTLLDATSGNTGAAYAIYGAALGVPVRLVMPANASPARKEVARAFGADLVESDAMEGPDGAVRLARSILADEPERFFYADQYANASNPRAHYEGTGTEIAEALGDRITHFVAGVGTSGTLMGTARRLRELARVVRCVAVQPDDALHGLEGFKHLGSTLVPAIYDARLVDETVTVTTEDGWDMAERCAREEGITMGRSSGANVFAALRLALQLSARGERGCVVTVVCDGGDRLFSPAEWEQRYGE